MPSPTSPPDRRPVVRLFVSSTFSDMGAERNNLARSAFQRLRHDCEQRGIVWTEVDLRWGITDAQRLSDQVLPICLSEIDRCRPYFIAILGERYGWECEVILPDLVALYPWLAGREGTSITELEVRHGALENVRNASRAFIYMRAADFVDTIPASERHLYVEGPTPDELRDLGSVAHARAAARTHKLAAFKAQIRESGLPVVDGYRDAAALDALVFRDLSQAIDADFPEAHAPSAAVHEAWIHEEFASTRTSGYFARESDFHALDAYAVGDGLPLLVTGEPGIGKTSLLANWAVRHRERNQATAVIPYYTGASAESTDWRHLVSSIAVRLGFPIGAGIREPEPLRVAFANALHRAAAQHRHVIILDALNQLDDRDGALDLAWLPSTLPPSIRVVISSLDGRVTDECRRRNCPSFTVRPLAHAARNQLLTTYLRERYAKTLATDQRDRILAAPLSANPLWLTALLEELRLFGDHATLDARIDHYLAANSVPELFERILARWEADYETDRPGLIGDAMRALWAARRGLSDVEVREVVGGATGALPALSWSVFQFAADRSLVNRSGLIGFFHEYLRSAVRARYLAGPNDERAAHRQLARYFAEQPQSPRRTDELPWQLERAEEWNELTRLLSDLRFFHDAWEKDELDIKHYWARLEAESVARRVDAYRDVVASPGAHVRDADAVATLLSESGSVAEAMLMYERLASWFEQMADSLERARALTKLATARDFLGHREDALAALSDAEGAFRELNAKRDLLVVLGHQAQIHTRQGSPDLARGERDQALSIARELGDEYNTQALLVGQAEILIDQDALADAERCLLDAQLICVKLADRDALQRVYGYLSRLRYFQRRFDEALRLGELKEAICVELGDESGRANALNTRAVVLSEAGRIDESLRLLDTAAAVYRRIGNVSGLADTLGNLGAVRHHKQQLDEALALYQEQERLYREHGELVDLDSSLFNQALVHVSAERPDSALELFETAMAAAERAGHRSTRSSIRIFRAQVLSDRGDHASAYRELKESLRELDEIGNNWERARAFRSMADTLLAAGRPHDALAAAAWAERVATEMNSDAAIANALDTQAKILAHEGDDVGALAVRARELDLRSRLGKDIEVQATAAEVITIAHRVGDMPAMMTAIDLQAEASIRLGQREELLSRLRTTIASLESQDDLDDDNHRYLAHLHALLGRSAAAM